MAMSHGGGGTGSSGNGGGGGTIASQEEAQQLRRQTTELLYRFHRKQQELQQEKELYGDDDETGVNRGENVWDMITDEEYEQILTRQFQQKTSLNSKEISDDTNHDHMVYPSVIQQDFEKALIDGRLSKWISVWEPWWLSSPLSSLSSSVSSISQQKLPPLSQLVSNQASSGSGRSNRVLRFYLIEMVYAFAYVMRLYNGEFCDDENGENTIDEGEVSDEKLDLLFEMIDVLLSLCPNSLHVMNSAVSSSSHSVIRYDNVTQVILNVLEMMTTMNATTAFAHDPQNRKELQCRSIHVLNDVIMILKNKAHVVRCLSQLHSMVLRLIDHLKEQQKKNEKTVVTMNRLERMAMQQEQQSSFIKQSAGSSLGKQIKFLRLVERKIYFYRVWCNEQSESTLFELSQDVESEYEQQRQLEMQK